MTVKHCIFKLQKFIKIALHEKHFVSSDILYIQQSIQQLLALIVLPDGLCVEFFHKWASANSGPVDCQTSGVVFTVGS
jgi:hypothetical protein